MKTKKKQKDFQIFDSEKFLEDLRRRNPKLSKKERKRRKQIYEETINSINEDMRKESFLYKQMEARSLRHARETFLD